MNTAEPPTPVRALRIALTGTAVVALAGYFAVYLIYTRALLNFPFDYDQGEGFELYDTILLSRGESPYRDNSVYPFYASNYPPLYHVLILPLVPFTGATYFTGRLVAFWGTLITGAAVMGIVRREVPVGRTTLPLLAAGAWFASNYVYHIGPLLRQHMTMVMFETLAIAFIARSEGPHRRRNLVIAMGAILAAGYTKQLAVGTAAAAIGYLFLRNPRRAVVAGSLAAAVAGGVFLALNAATHGQWYVNIIAANINEFHPEQAVELYGQWFRLHGPLIVCAVGLLIYELYWTRLSAYSIWLAAATAIAALSGKWGAGESYFVTAVTAACVCSAIALGRLWGAAQARRPRLGWAIGLLVPLLYLVYARQVLHYPTQPPAVRAVAEGLGLPVTGTPYVDSVGYTQLGRPPDAQDILGGQTIAAIVRDRPGPALSEEAGFPLYAGKPVITNPTQLLNLWKNNLLDSTALDGMIRAQAFGVVILRAHFYPPPVLDAIFTAYTPTAMIPMNGFHYTIMLPKEQNRD